MYRFHSQTFGYHLALLATISKEEILSYVPSLPCKNLFLIFLIIAFKIQFNNKYKLCTSVSYR